MHKAEIAKQEKLSAARSSVISAVFLTTTKIVVGVMTGSLGILAEAAHSALDLVAAVVTFVAVHISSKPADKDHLYGHGKVENLSALIETLLLLATCGWIIYEAVERLFFKPKEVEATIWAFGVMALSIVIDVHRSRKLYAAARKHNSQALEADALHFSTDIWSSAVVIGGLVCIKIADFFPSQAWLNNMDAIAALVVAAIVVWVSLELGMKTIAALLDTAPKGKVEEVKRIVEAIPGVTDCHHIRLRYSGAHLFVDIHVHMDGDQTLRQAHQLSDTIEEALLSTLPDADITIHAEPAPEDEENEQQRDASRQ